jgi:hypothetical protein
MRKHLPQATGLFILETSRLKRIGSGPMKFSIEITMPLVI